MSSGSETTTVVPPNCQPPPVEELPVPLSIPSGLVVTESPAPANNSPPAGQENSLVDVQTPALLTPPSQIKSLDMAEQNKVLGNLLLAARQTSQTDAITVIQSYNHIIEHERNVAILKDLPRAALDSAAIFLRITITDTKGKKLFKNRADIADRIVLAIESYLPATCLNCSSSYSIEFGNEPSRDTLRCFFCYQYAHDACNIKLYGPHGTTWLCGSCIAKHEGPDQEYSAPPCHPQTCDQSVSATSQPVIAPVDIPASVNDT